MTTSPPARRRSLVSLAVGFLALGVAMLAAHYAPARGYELSIYRQTPLTYWIPLGLSLVLSTYVAVSARSTWAWLGGLVCSGGGVASVGALPLIRGYYFYGAADGLTHLGWTKDIIVGALEPTNMLYPGIHTFTIILSRATGLTLHRAMIYVVFTFLILYLVSMPLLIWLLTDRRWLVTAGAYTGMFFLVINQISTHYMTAHPFSQATQMLPIALFVLVLYLVSGSGNTTSGDHRVTAIGALFALSSIAAVFYHPEHAVNLSLLVGTVLVLQLVLRRTTTAHRILEHRVLLPQAVLLGGVTAVWTAVNSRGTRSATILTNEFLEFVRGAEGAAGVVTQRQGSLLAIGASIEEIFFKLFFVMALFAGLTGLLILAAGMGRVRGDQSDTGAVTAYLSLGQTILVPASLVLFVGGISKLFFRNVGTIMVVSSVLGVLALAYLSGIGDRATRLRPIADRVRGILPSSGPVRTALSVIVILALLIHSLALFFPSPYIYQPNNQVSEQMMTGHDTVIQYGLDDVEVSKLRTGLRRYIHGIYGPTRTDTFEMRDDALLNKEENISRLTHLRSQYDGPWYVVVTEPDRLSEINAYDELRFNRTDFVAVDRQVGVSRVHDNGEVQTYFVT